MEGTMFPTEVHIKDSLPSQMEEELHVASPSLSQQHHYRHFFEPQFPTGCFYGPHHSTGHFNGPPYPIANTSGPTEYYPGPTEHLNYHYSNQSKATLELEVTEENEQEVTVENEHEVGVENEEEQLFLLHSSSTTISKDTVDRKLDRDFCKAFDKCYTEFLRKKQHQMNEYLDSAPLVESDHNCEICSQTFTTARGLREHMRLHTGKLHKCTLCSKQYVTSRSLLYHKRAKHENRLDFKCDLCPYVCVRKNVLNAHMRTHTKDRKKTFQCIICLKSFTDRRWLKEHVSGYHCGVRHKCDICGVDYAYKSSLTAHMVTHTAQEKPHKCAICGHGFYRKRKLTAHERIHSGAKPFSCTVCGRAFRTNEKLQRHLNRKTKCTSNEQGEVSFLQKD